MPSTALLQWQNDRATRLNEVDAHCASVIAMVPPNPVFVDETLRGYVMHLSAHFQGFCRDLYTECAQICVLSMAVGLQSMARIQFTSQLALEKGNPSYDNIKKDFNRFGLILNLQSTLVGQRQVTDLGHLNEWRNKAAHQVTKPLAGGVPMVLTLPVIQNWRLSCNGLATALDSIMYAELLQSLGVAPW